MEFSSAQADVGDCWIPKWGGGRQLTLKCGFRGRLEPGSGSGCYLTFYSPPHHITGRYRVRVVVPGGRSGVMPPHGVTAGPEGVPSLTPQAMLVQAPQGTLSRKHC